MLDKRSELMLQLADTLTAEELDAIRAGAPAPAASPKPAPAPLVGEAPYEQLSQEDDGENVQAGDLTRGERERMRTRESKVSTGCIGQPRTAHEWWPIGTELVGQIGGETFTATVVENPRVKSGRSVLITSGAAKGTTCLTPTRAAIDATEAYRKAHNLGRGGGITNGWTFWKPRS